MNPLNQSLWQWSRSLDSLITSPFFAVQTPSKLPALLTSVREEKLSAYEKISGRNYAWCRVVVAIHCIDSTRMTILDEISDFGDRVGVEITAVQTIVSISLNFDHMDF